MELANEKPARTLEEINKDYGKTAAEYGHLAYQLKLIPLQMDNLKDQLDALTKEAAELQAKK